VSSIVQDSFRRGLYTSLQNILVIIIFDDGAANGTAHRPDDVIATATTYCGCTTTRENWRDPSNVQDLSEDASMDGRTGRSSHTPPRRFPIRQRKTRVCWYLVRGRESWMQCIVVFYFTCSPNNKTVGSRAPCIRVPVRGRRRDLGRTRHTCTVYNKINTIKYPVYRLPAVSA